MFYAQSENKYIVEGTSFELNGVQYPAVWLNQSTATEKAQIGLVEVVTTNSPADSKFYWVSESLQGAELTYTNTPKDLDSLKTQLESEITSAAYSLLQPTDYIDLRNLRDPNYKLDWMLWRDSVRLKHQEVTLAITNSATISELQQATSQIEWPHDPNYIPPIVEPTLDPTNDKSI